MEFYLKQKNFSLSNGTEYLDLGILYTPAKFLLLSHCKTARVNNFSYCFLH